MKSRGALGIRDKLPVLTTEQMYSSYNEIQKSERGPQGDQAGFTGRHKVKIWGSLYFIPLRLDWSYILGLCRSVG